MFTEPHQDHLRPPDAGKRFPLHEPILLVTFAVVALGGIAVLGRAHLVPALGLAVARWFTSVDHKKIGIMYMILGIVMLLRGFADAHHDARCSRRSPSAATRATCRRTTTTRSSPPTA